MLHATRAIHLLTGACLAEHLNCPTEWGHSSVSESSINEFYQSDRAQIDNDASDYFKSVTIRDSIAMGSAPVMVTDHYRWRGTSLAYLAAGPTGGSLIKLILAASSNSQGIRNQEAIS